METKPRSGGSSDQFRDIGEKTGAPSFLKAHSELCSLFTVSPCSGAVTTRNRRHLKEELLGWDIKPAPCASLNSGGRVASGPGRESGSKREEPVSVRVRIERVRGIGVDIWAVGSGWRQV